jgi:hypothetical protein
MNLTTQSALARLVGVSRQAIYDAIKNEHIPHVEQNRKKKIDLDDPRIQNYIKGNPQRNRKKEEKPKTEPKKGSKKKKEPAEKKSKPDIKESLELKGEVDLSEVDDLNTLSKYDLERYQKMVVIEKEKIKIAKDRGELIDRDLVVRIFSKIYQIDVNNFLQLSHALAPRIVQSVFKTSDPEKITETTKMIDEELYKTQNYIQREIDEFLESIKTKEVPKNDNN